MCHLIFKAHLWIAPGKRHSCPEKGTANPEKGTVGNRETQQRRGFAGHSAAINKKKQR
jgi:hypothetical protein